MAERHPRNWYGWMLRGEAVYAALGRTHRLHDGTRATAWSPRAPVCFETFPQAIACALSGAIVSARHKRTVREALLRRAGIDTTLLTNIDWIDAALCAVAARVTVYGDAEEGVIVVPVEEVQGHRV